jgi:hypothetical protein
VSSLKKFEGEMPEEIENTCYLPTGIISLPQDEVLLMACGMESYMYIELEGDGVCQIRQRLSEELNAITLMPRNNSTIESVGFVLRSNSELLWSEFHEINSKFEELCKNGNMHFNYGIVEEKDRSKRIFLSIFYFTGEVKHQSSDDASFHVDEEFLAQVRTINKNLH